MTGDGAIFGPFLALMLLTFAVWVLLYVRRIGWMRANRIDAQDVASPESLRAAVPVRVANPSNNFKNLFELPVLFYVLCLALYVTGSVDSVYVIAAWLFVALRVVHSAIHCTVNVVIARFGAYMCGAIVLWFMAGRAAVDLL